MTGALATEEALSDMVALETENGLEGRVDSVAFWDSNAEIGTVTLQFLCPSPRTILS